MSSVNLTGIFFHKSSKDETPEACAVRRQNGVFSKCWLFAAASCWHRAHGQRSVQFERKFGAGGQSCGTVLGQPMHGGRRCANGAANENPGASADQAADQHSAGSASAGFEGVAAVVA